MIKGQTIVLCTATCPGPDGTVSCLVRTLTPQASVVGDHAFRCDPRSLLFGLVENLSIAWLGLSDFWPGSHARHFVHYESSSCSLRLSNPPADCSILMASPQLFPYLEDCFIHTSYLPSTRLPPGSSRIWPVLTGDSRLSISTFSCNFRPTFCLTLKFPHCPSELFYLSASHSVRIATYPLCNPPPGQSANE